MRSAFEAFGDIHRAHFEANADSGGADMSALEKRPSDFARMEQGQRDDCNLQRLSWCSWLLVGIGNCGYSR